MTDETHGPIWTVAGIGYTVPDEAWAKQVEQAMGDRGEVGILTIRGGMSVDGKNVYQDIDFLTTPYVAAYLTANLQKISSRYDRTDYARWGRAYIDAYEQINVEADDEPDDSPFGPITTETCCNDEADDRDTADTQEHDAELAAAAFRGDVDPHTGIRDNATSDAFAKMGEQHDEAHGTVADPKLTTLVRNFAEAGLIVTAVDPVDFQAGTADYQPGEQQ